jgi:type VI secretion system secreted protein VgrG
VPKINGLSTAPADATGDAHPTLDEMGRYKVKLPFDRSGNNDYNASKHIRLSQPSGGVTGDDNTPYGIHFPSKLGAEMVLAYVDGNPDKPIGLGFVPNALALSVVRSENCLENVIRSWGGNKLVMDDTDGSENTTLSTPGERLLELHDGEERLRLKSADSQLTLNDSEKYAAIEAGKYSVNINYKDDNGAICIKTAKSHEINIDDNSGTILVKTAGGTQLLMDDANQSVILSNNNNQSAGAGELRLESKGEIHIKADKGVFINGSAVKILSENGDINIKSQSSIGITGKTVAQEASEKIEMAAPDINLQGSSAVSIESQDTTVIGKTAVTVEAGSAAELTSGYSLLVKAKTKTAIEGGMVTIN